MTGAQEHEHVGSLAEELAKLLETVTGSAGTGSAHIATGSDECTVCPLCRAIALVRTTSPEVREHLTTSAVAVTTAAKGLLDAFAAHQQARAPRTPDAPGPDERDSGVENIDLAEDESWD